MVPGGGSNPHDRKGSADFESAGYLRNVYGVKDLELVGHLETAVFQQEVLRTVRSLRRVQIPQYEHLLETHRQFFHFLSSLGGCGSLDHCASSRHRQVRIQDLILPPSRMQTGQGLCTATWAGREIYSRASWGSVRVFRSRPPFS